MPVEFLGWKQAKGKGKRGRVTSLLKRLHWLLVKTSIKYNIRLPAGDGLMALRLDIC